MNPGGLQQFEIDVYDAGFKTGNPADSLVGLDIQATVAVTIKWNDAGTALDPSGIDTADPDKNGVNYDDPTWAGEGNGPFDLYEQGIASVRKIGTVKWSVTTKTLFSKELDPTGTKSRISVTPTVNLIRTTTLNGQRPSSETVYTNNPPAQDGNWV